MTSHLCKLQIDSLLYLLGMHNTLVECILSSLQRLNYAVVRSGLWVTGVAHEAPKMQAGSRT